jgi:murein DD-endopeptidase MepM/ murein hydrolase activator NlpD
MARVRGPATLAAPVLIVGGVLARDALPGGVGRAVWWTGAGLLVVSLLASLLPVAPEAPPRVVEAPLTGRWVALNSPASRRPSHGTHGYGQTYAIDLVYETTPGDRPAFGTGASFRPPDDFPAYGQPILAPADAVVVAAYDRARDHRSRSSWPAFAYLLLEGMVREYAGARFLLGNHVVLDLGDGVYAAMAHLRRRSLAVRRGDRVRRGQLLARCGNSGNSSEPHLHFQLMDSRRPLLAAGVPFEFAGVTVEGGGTGGVPANRGALLAGAPAPADG